MVRPRTNTGNSGFGKKAGLPSGRMSRVQKRRGSCRWFEPKPTSHQSVTDLMALFREFDTNKDGFININELAAAFFQRNTLWANVGFTTETLVEVFTDNMFTEDQKLSFDEFVTFNPDDVPIATIFNAIIQFGFKKIDTNNNNFMEWHGEFRGTVYYREVAIEPIEQLASTDFASFAMKINEFEDTIRQYFGKTQVGQPISSEEFVASGSGKGFDGNLALMIAIYAIRPSAEAP